MPALDRILAAYEQGLKKLADDLVAQSQTVAARAGAVDADDQGAAGRGQDLRGQRARPGHHPGGRPLGHRRRRHPAPGAQRLAATAGRRRADDSLVRPLPQQQPADQAHHHHQRRAAGRQIDPAERAHRPAAQGPSHRRHRRVRRGPAHLGRAQLHRAAQGQGGHPGSPAGVPQGGRHEAHLGRGGRTGAARRAGVPRSPDRRPVRRSHHLADDRSRGHPQRLARDPQADGRATEKAQSAGRPPGQGGWRTAPRGAGRSR